MTNYPDSTWDCDPAAPWNRAELWEAETCGTCRWLREAEFRGRRCSACTCPDRGLVFDSEPGIAACDCWEAR